MICTNLDYAQYSCARFELVTKIDIDIHKKNRYASYDLRRKIEMQHEEFQKMTEREQVPLLKSPE
ncbi:hypothetical protein DMP75_26770 (plasmid) [Klebsiella michiganensis]|nr:hypothetical protein DMP75_26770 [Klebsiella michiganensis]